MDYPIIKNAVCSEDHKYFTSIYLPESLLYGGEGEVVLVCDYCRRRYTINSSLMQQYYQGKIPKILEKVVIFNNKIYHARQNLHAQRDVRHLVVPYIDTILLELSNMIYDIFAGRFIRWNRLSPNEEVVNSIINHISDVYLNSFDVVTSLIKTGREMIQTRTSRNQTRQRLIDIFSTRQIQEYQYLEMGLDMSVPYAHLRRDILQFYRQPKIHAPARTSQLPGIIRNSIPKSIIG